jgi:hypothetical protein
MFAGKLGRQQQPTMENLTQAGGVFKHVHLLRPTEGADFWQPVTEDGKSAPFTALNLGGTRNIRYK